MLDVRFRPLAKWRESTPLGRKNGPFKMPSLHPDRGGSAELFQALGEVARVLDAHHAKRSAEATSVRR
jgi:hypothetical protein